MLEVRVTVDPYSFHCPNDDSLLRTNYRKERLKIRDLPGIWRLQDCLSVRGRIEEGVGGPIAYRSETLAKELGPEDL